jgi:hypothetical protein
MAITPADVVIRASQRMHDFADGGGPMSTQVIVDGLDNNLFDDVTDLQFMTGHHSLRKLFPAVLSNDAATFASAHVFVDGPASGSEVSVLLMQAPATAERNAVVDLLPQTPPTLPGFAPLYLGTGTATAGSADITAVTQYHPFPELAPIQIASGAAGAPNSIRSIASFDAPTTGSNGVVHLDRPVELSGPVIFYAILRPVTPRLYGAGRLRAPSSGNMLAGVSIAKARPLSDIFTGNNLTVGFSTAYEVPFVFPNDVLLVHHTGETAPLAVSNGATIDVGRGTLTMLRVLGANGVEHARFVIGQPAPTGVGCTANLATGLVSITDTAGMVQPIRVEHRIEEMARVLSIVGLAIQLDRALSRTYPTGSIFSSLLMLSDLKARAFGAFAQTAWTGVWADTVTGGSPAGDYNVATYPIACTNKGAINDRWYVRFTGPTAFRVVGEISGEVTTGNTGTNCAPINPATGAPYFTINAAGWSTGWDAGNILRINTTGANAAVWVVRSVSPSAPIDNDKVTLQLRGYTNTTI